MDFQLTRFCYEAVPKYFWGTFLVILHAFGHRSAIFVCLLFVFFIKNILKENHQSTKMFGSRSGPTFFHEGISIRIGLADRHCQKLTKFTAL